MAPARRRTTVIVVKNTETIVEKTKARMLPSNANQKAMHRSVMITVKWRSLWNGIFYWAEKEIDRCVVFYRLEFIHLRHRGDWYRQIGWGIYKFEIFVMYHHCTPEAMFDPSRPSASDREDRPLLEEVKKSSRNSDESWLPAPSPHTEIRLNDGRVNNRLGELKSDNWCSYWNVINKTANVQPNVNRMDERAAQDNPGARSTLVIGISQAAKRWF